jgi:hypothetical protein
MVGVDLHHPPLDITIHFASSKRTKPLHPSNIDPSKDWNFNRADYDLLFIAVGRLDWVPVLASASLTEAVQFFYEKIYDTFKKLVPKKRRSKVTLKRYPVWFNPNIIKDINRKNLITLCLEKIKMS